MIRRPPRSTLFPYTDALPICTECGSPLHEDQAACLSCGAMVDHGSGFAGIRRAAVGSATALLVLGTADRKSTRLNSSHANISYAVFCLKKKNTYIHVLLSLFT